MGTIRRATAGLAMAAVLALVCYVLTAGNGPHEPPVKNGTSQARAVAATSPAHVVRPARGTTSPHAAASATTSSHPSTTSNHGTDLATMAPANPAEGHSPQLARQLQGSLSGTGEARSLRGTQQALQPQQSSVSTVATVNGIDVSAFQHPDGAAINWGKVHAAGYDYAAIKVTEGNYYVNHYYASDAKAAIAAGLYVSAYHFANPPKSSGTAQADYAVKNAGGYHVGGRYLPLVLDIEYDPYSSNECYGISTSAMVRWISAFVTETAKKTGAKPIIYTPPAWWNKCTHNSTAFGGDLLWVPAYRRGSPGQLPAGWKTWTIWQYTSGGTVNGIRGQVDLDYVSVGLVSEVSAVDTTTSIQLHTLSSLAGQQLSFTASGLPPGVRIDSAGLISGTPTRVGTYHVKATARGAATTTISFTWYVVGVSLASPGNQQTFAPDPVDLTVRDTDPEDGYQPSFSAKGLPQGLSISGGGTITGMPYTTGTYQVTVTARDALGASGSTSFTWTVTPIPDPGATIAHPSPHMGTMSGMLSGD
jgi:GH25 family lysozyme M1 (1,4-beta-N-acetylmuramidase)